MGYIDENLMNGEKVVYRTRLHKVVFLGPAIFVLLAVMFFGSKETAPAMTFFFMIAIIWGISAYISLQSSEFGITNKRVLIKVGFLRRAHSVETLLTKVEGIQVNQGILGRILNYGTIYVRGTGGTSNPFHRIEAPMEFRKKVQEQIASL